MAASLSRVGFLSPAHTSVNSLLVKFLTILAEHDSVSRQAFVPWPVCFCLFFKTIALIFVSWCPCWTIPQVRERTSVCVCGGGWGAGRAQNILRLQSPQARSHGKVCPGGYGN